MSEATLVEEGGRPGVRLERRLPDPPATVWRAITDRDELRSWFPCDVVVAGGEWVVGASIAFEFPPEVIDLTLTGKVLDVDIPRRLVYTWGEETLRFELSDDDGGTRLVLVDELAPGAAARNAAGWRTVSIVSPGSSQTRGPGNSASTAMRPPSRRLSVPRRAHRRVTRVESPSRRICGFPTSRRGTSQPPGSVWPIRCRGRLHPAAAEL